jgi:hypothetical protein
MSLIHQGRRNTISRELMDRHLSIAPDLHPYIFPLYHPHSLDILLFWDIPSSGRSGHVLISGAIVGAEHGALHDVIREAQEMKVKRSIYAETQMEKSSTLEAIRTSEWNAEMNPVSLTTIEPGIINHDFSETYVPATCSYFQVFTVIPHRSCHVSVTMVLRNFSMSHPSKYTLKLASETTVDGPSVAKCVYPLIHLASTA